MSYDRKGRSVLSRWGKVAALLAVAAGCLWAPAAQAQQSPGEGPGGPVLVVVDPGDAFGRYYAEILRAEGLNEFAVAEQGALSAQTLAAYKVVVLAETELSTAQAATLDTWVRGGGNLIAMRPDARLAPTLGLGSDAGDLDDEYLQIAPSWGVTAETMQFHGRADRWTLAGATTVATLYSSATQATSNPAVTLRTLGAGQAAAFTYDLARSVVYTRQGNPAWDGMERDGGVAPIVKRSDDLFFGNPGNDRSADWVDHGKVAIPQADEQQRLLANLITRMSDTPLPRFWYLPRGEKAAVVMTGDDHDSKNPNGTKGQFEWFEGRDPQGCSVADWECVRATSYAYDYTVIPGAKQFQDAGFEIALHLSTGCQDEVLADLRGRWEDQLEGFAQTFPGIDHPVTNRTHCVIWSDWASEALAAAEQGVRLDTNYYYWPQAFVQDAPGMFTGSGFPMRFAEKTGALIDVYQAATQLNDEAQITYQAHIDALLDGALGNAGYYGVFTANMHTDHAEHLGAQTIVGAAQDNGVPVVSAKQMLTWLDGRNGSSFGSVDFSGGRLRFTVTRDARANGLVGMVPMNGPGGTLSGLRRAGVDVGYTARTIKGVDYALFDAAAGAYTATYGAPEPLPQPDTAITAFSVTGKQATASFSSNVAGARFECRLDGGAFATCASPWSQSGLSVGLHTFEVRANDDAEGTQDATPAARGFSVAADTPPADGAGGPGEGGGTDTPETGETPVGPDRVAPWVLIRTRSARIDARGAVALRVSCPQGEVRCTVRLALRRGGKDVATRTVTLRGGRTQSFRLRVKRAARTKVLRKGSLRFTAVAKARDLAGNEATARKAVKLLAPMAR
jgi:hypothetical protein